MSDAKECSWAHVAFRAMGEAGREISLTIQGTSMLPLLRSGDRASIRPLPANGIECGDVFAFWENGSIVVHRCVGKTLLGDALRLCQKGDNLSDWGWVSQAEVVGKVMRVTKSGKVLDLSAFPWAWLGSVMAWSFWVWIQDVEQGRGLTRIFRLPGFAMVLSVWRRPAIRTLQAFWLPALRCFGKW